MPKNKTKLHDEFFKVTFSEKQIAAGYIRQFVDKSLVSKLDLSKLKLENTSYTTKVLKKYFSDIVYTCPYMDTSVTISFLFEHKSSPVAYPHVQLLRYILEIWETNIKNKKPLQIILPLVFYHGQEHWEYRSIKHYFTDLDEDLLSYIPRFDYHLMDVSQWSDERIIELQEAFLVNTLLVFKHIWDESYLLNNIQKLFIKLDEYIDTYQGRNLFHSIVVYLFRHSNFSEQMVERMIDQMQEPLQGEAMSTYDRLIEKGVEKQLLLATKNMLEESIAPAKIAKLLGISESEVNQIIEKLKGKKLEK